MIPPGGSDRGAHGQVTSASASTDPAAGRPDQCLVIRPMAAQALAKLGPAAAPAVSALSQMLRQGSSPFEQQVAAQSLAQIGVPALAALADVMAHEKGVAGNAAALALLWHYRWPRPGRAAGEDLPGDPTAPARQQAIETLGASGRADELVVNVLARAAVDPAPGVRRPPSRPSPRQTAIRKPPCRS